MKSLLYLYVLFFFFVLGNTAFPQSKKEIHSIHRVAFQLSSNEPDSSLTLLKEAKSKSLEIGYDWGSAFTDYLTARIHMLRNNDAMALIKFSEAQTRFSESDTLDLYNEYVMFWNMARITYRNGSYSNANEFYGRAYEKITQMIKRQPKEAKKLDALEKLDNISYFQALALKRNGDIVEATSKLLKLLDGDRLSNNDSRVRNQIGLIHKDLKKYKEATRYFLEVISSEESSTYYTSLASHNLGYIMMLENNMSEGQLYFNRAITLSNALLKDKNSASYRRQLFSSHLDLGELHFRTGDLNSAISSWKQALEVYKEIDSNPEYYIVHNWLLKGYLASDVDKARFHNQQYMAYNKRYLKVRSEVSDVLKTQLFENQMARYEEAKKHIEVQITNKSTYHSSLLILGVIAFLTTAFLLWYFKVYRKNRTFRDMVKVANWQSVPDSELPGKL